jgi:D-sedoheptulose 7-phosphate isomerase
MNFTDYKDYTLKALESVDAAEVEALIETVGDAFERDATIFVIGNGGSAANASHFAQDLAKGTCADLNGERRIRALSLTDNFAFFSALGNDEGYDQVFVQQLRTFFRPGDVLVAISGSGNSPNVLRAVEFANANGMTTVGITGFDGGRLRSIASSCVHVPLNDMCTAESIHSILFHYVILRLREVVAAVPATGR